MTQQLNPQTPQVINLAEPTFPAVRRVVSDRVFQEPKEKTIGCPHCKGHITLQMPAEEKPSPITWMFGAEHPFVPDMMIIRMFLVDDGVAVYMVSKDQKVCMRVILPTATLRFVEEAMPGNVFAEELAAAEEDNAYDGEDEPEDEPEEEPEQAQSTVPNGQSAS